MKMIYRIISLWKYNAIVLVNKMYNKYSPWGKTQEGVIKGKNSSLILNNYMTLFSEKWINWFLQRYKYFLTKQNWAKFDVSIL